MMSLSASLPNYWCSLYVFAALFPYSGPTVGGMIYRVSHILLRRIYIISEMINLAGVLVSFGWKSNGPNKYVSLQHRLMYSLKCLDVFSGQAHFEDKRELCYHSCNMCHLEASLVGTILFTSAVYYSILSHLTDYSDRKNRNKFRFLCSTWCQIHALEVLKKRLIPTVQLELYVVGASYLLYYHDFSNWPKQLTTCIYLLKHIWYLLLTTFSSACSKIERHY